MKTLADKVVALKEELGKEYTHEVLVGTKVSVEITSETTTGDKVTKTIEGNFRQFQTNGLATVYLKERYEIKQTNGRNTDTKWIKISPHMLNLI